MFLASCNDEALAKEIKFTAICTSREVILLPLEMLRFRSTNRGPLWKRFSLQQYRPLSMILFVCPSKILHKHCFHFLLGHTMVPRENKGNTYAKFWTDKNSVMVFLKVAYYLLYEEKILTDRIRPTN